MYVRKVLMSNTRNFTADIYELCWLISYICGVVGSNSDTYFLIIPLGTDNTMPFSQTLYLLGLLLVRVEKKSILSLEQTNITRKFL